MNHTFSIQILETRGCLDVLDGRCMSGMVWMRHLSPHTRALARLAKPSQSKACLARHGMVWYGVSFPYCQCRHFGGHFLQISPISLGQIMFPQAYWPRTCKCGKMNHTFSIQILETRGCLDVLDGRCMSEMVWMWHLSPHTYARSLAWPRQAKPRHGWHGMACLVWCEFSLSRISSLWRPFSPNFTNNIWSDYVSTSVLAKDM